MIDVRYQCRLTETAEESTILEV